MRSPQLVLLAINPLAWVGGFVSKLIKVAILFVLVRGFFAAREAEALKRQLV
jgi:hypothetical protein